MDVSEALLKPGSIISEKWEIVSQIGKGAFGITVVAKNLETKVFQAIKFEIDDASTKGGLLQEVKALQTLQGNSILIFYSKSSFLEFVFLRNQIYSTRDYNFLS